MNLRKEDTADFEVVEIDKTLLSAVDSASSLKSLSKGGGFRVRNVDDIFARPLSAVSAESLGTRRLTGRARSSMDMFVALE